MKILKELWNWYKMPIILLILALLFWGIYGCLFELGVIINKQYYNDFIK